MNTVGGISNFDGIYKRLRGFFHLEQRAFTTRRTNKLGSSVSTIRLRKRAKFIKRARRACYL